MIPSVQCTGHCDRSRRKSSCGGPSWNCSRSATRTWSRGAWSCPVVLMGATYPRRRARATPPPPRFRSASSSSHGSVFATSAAVSHARRAVATAQRWRSSVVDAVRVGVEHELHPGGGRRARVHVVQVTAVRLAVDLEEGAGARGRLDQRADVDVVAGALADQPTGRVADHVDERMLDRAHDPRGHRVAGHPERRVRARDDPVELLEHLVVVVERAVGQDVHLAAREHADPVEPLVDPVHRVDVAQQRVGRDVVAEAVARGVVGDREVLVAAARARRAPSPRSCRARRSRRCGSAGRRAGRRAVTSRGGAKPGSSSPRSSRSSGSTYVRPSRS